MLLKKLEKAAFFDQLSRTLIFNYVNVYLLLLNISTGLLGFANSLFNLCSTISKYFTPKIMFLEKKFLITVKFLFAIMILILLFVNNIYIVIIIFSLIYIFDGAILVSKDSFISGLVNNNDKYYARLFFYAGLGALIALILANIVFFIDNSFLSVQFLYLMAYLYELISIYYFSRINFEIKQTTKYSVKKLFKNKDFFKITLAYALMFFAMALIMPFIVEYLLKYLKYSLAFFAFFNIVFLIFYDFTQNLVAKLDLVNLKTITLIGAIFVAMFPILFMLSTNQIYLLFMQIFIGFGFALLNYGMFSYIIAISDSEEKSHYLSVFYAMTTFPSVVAPFLGGVLLDYFLYYFNQKISYLFLFIISFLIRLFALYYFSTIKPVDKNDNIEKILYRLKERIRIVIH